MAASGAVMYATALKAHFGGRMRLIESARQYDSKIYSLDVGLLRRLSGLSPSAIGEGDRLLTEFKGALTENYILESLIAQFENAPRYWTSGNRAEVDFILQIDNDVIPIEVKADQNVTGKSIFSTTLSHLAAYFLCPLFPLGAVRSGQPFYL